jgi:hypothetical protein
MATASALRAISYAVANLFGSEKDRGVDNDY